MKSSNLFAEKWENSKYSSSSLRPIICDYLGRSLLPKVSCITNSLPNALKPLLSMDFFNYICFCSSNYAHKIETLCLAYIQGLRSIDYDVFVTSIEKGLMRRQFGYVYLDLDSLDKAQDILSYMVHHKMTINRNYPILIQLRCPYLEQIDLIPGIDKKTRLGRYDLICEIV